MTSRAHSIEDIIYISGSSVIL